MLCSALGLSLATYFTSPSRKVACDGPLPLSTPRPRPEVGAGQPEPQSILSLYELSFGAVCGICAGVFLKKGLKALAFVLGGVFVLLQYLSSKQFITVDWARFGSRYDSAFGTKAADGKVSAPTVGRLWAWFVDFLSANFQQRASFLAGLILGVRLG